MCAPAGQVTAGSMGLFCLCVHSASCAKGGAMHTTDATIVWQQHQLSTCLTMFCTLSSATGSLAIPLALRGAAVFASDISAAMAGEAEQRYQSAVSSGLQAPETAPMFEAKDLE
eukprot:GHRR01028048.1.p1 GENE.GHRR01028048.1~~GHRR01028048.1.p1  ORF type:complete len:114 (-),score=49.59 GHRR01028048.1:899-1240(-)